MVQWSFAGTSIFVYSSHYFYLRSVDKGVEINFLIILRIFLGMLLGAALLLFFNVLIMSHISSGLIGFIEKITFAWGF